MQVGEAAAGMVMPCQTDYRGGFTPVVGKRSLLRQALVRPGDFAGAGAAGAGLRLAAR